MRYIKKYFVDDYLMYVLKYDLCYKFNYKFKFGLLMGSSKINYVNRKKYSIVLLSRIYKIMRETYNIMKIKSNINRRYYLKGRKLLEIVKFKNYLIELDFLMSFNYLFFYIYRIILNYNGLFLILLSNSKLNRDLILFWNDFPTRLAQINQTLGESTNSFFKIELYRVTLNFYFHFVFSFNGPKSLILLNFLSFFGFFIPRKKTKLYQYFVRII